MAGSRSDGQWPCPGQANADEIMRVSSRSVVRAIRGHDLTRTPELPSIKFAGCRKSSEMFNRRILPSFAADNPPYVLLEKVNGAAINPGNSSGRISCAKRNRLFFISDDSRCQAYRANCESPASVRSWLKMRHLERRIRTTWTLSMAKIDPIQHQNCQRGAGCGLCQTRQCMGFEMIW